MAKEVTAIGIDLGTSNSCVCVYRQGQLEVLVNEKSKKTIRSMVGFDDVSDRIVVGESAEDEFKSSNVIHGVKRFLGKKLTAEFLKKNKKFFPYDLTSANGDPKIKVTHNRKLVTFDPEEISSQVLKELKQLAEQRLGVKEVTKVVVTVPAHFDQLQREATEKAAKLAGFEDVSLLKEPIAAAMSFGLDKKSKGIRKVLVFDLGAGTFDVTVLTIESHTLQVKATGGDNSLGGDDFTNSIVQYFADLIKKDHKKDVFQDQKATRRLNRACEKLKRQLSERSKATCEDIPSLLPGIDFSVSMTRDCFNQMIKERVLKTIEIMDKTMASSRIAKKDITDIVLIGGSTHVPLVQSEITKYFEKRKLTKGMFPEEAVVRGAAIQAIKKSENCPAYIRNVYLGDVLSLSVRVGLDGGLTVPMAKINDPIPCIVKKSFTTSRDDQEVLTFQFYEGERTKTVDNALLGSIRMEGLKPLPKGMPTVEVIFESDENSNFTITAKDKETQKTETLKKCSNTLSMDSDDLANVITDAQEHKEEDEKEEIRIRARNELKSFLESILSCFRQNQPGFAEQTALRSKVQKEADRIKAWLQEEMEQGWVFTAKEYNKEKDNLSRVWEPLIASGHTDSSNNQDVEFL